jgi:hypothetical protein
MSGQKPLQGIREKKDAPVKYDLLMSEARKMASQLNMPETEFMALCETVAADAWGK